MGKAKVGAPKKSPNKKSQSRKVASQRRKDFRPVAENGGANKNDSVSTIASMGTTVTNFLVRGVVSSAIALLSPSKTKALPPTTKKQPGGGLKNGASSSSISKVLSEFDWKMPFILGEKIHTGVIDTIHQGPYPGVGWDFSHVSSVISSALQEHFDCDIFLFGGSPRLACIGSNDIINVPFLNAILVPHGHTPPEFVSIRKSQQGTEEIVPFCRLKLKWQNVSGQIGCRVFSLQCMQRKAAMKNMKEEDLYNYEYSILYTQRPSSDWRKDKYGNLDIRFANFKYDAPGLEEPVYEEFDKEFHRLKAFIPDFLERFDLDDSHYEGVEAAIRTAFNVARDVKRQQIALLEEYDEDVLENMKVIKIYPKNGFLEDHHKDNEVNRYYGKAAKIV